MLPVRTECLSKLRQVADRGEPILGVGAGTGISAKFAEAGGADLIIIYNSGRFRMAGRGSTAGLLAYGDANAIVMDMAEEVLPVVNHTPVLAGVCGTDPFRRMTHFLPQIRDIGFAGVQNFPSVGIIDGNFRLSLEETGMGFGLEIEMIRIAHALDLLTCPYAFNPEEARCMALAGADLVVAHMGLTTKGSIGATTAMPLEEAVERVQAIRDAAVCAKPDVLVICHGGPIAEPDDARFVLKKTNGVHGFFGASSIERLAVERAIAEETRMFKRMLMD
ncbi:MAG: phosphoenolpyruvate hydrolase family protein [Bryobacteraceae bacterium]